MESRELFEKLDDNISLSLMTKENAHNLFKDFKNDVSLYLNKNDFKEYLYNYDEVEKYVSNKIEKGYILISIKYNNDVIGEIRFKGIDDSKSEIGIILKNNKYKNKGIGSIAIKKALIYAKESLNINKVYASILKTNERSQHVFKKIGFVFLEDDEQFVKYYINL